MPLKAKFHVSDNIEEPMLGIDWITENAREWNFDKRSLVIDNRDIPLRMRPSRARIRRVYVEDVMIQPGMEVSIPVRLSWGNWRAPETDWLIELKEVSEGVFLASSLLP
jgi:hypothetical protein